MAGHYLPDCPTKENNRGSIYFKRIQLQQLFHLKKERPLNERLPRKSKNKTAQTKNTRLRTVQKKKITLPSTKRKGKESKTRKNKKPRHPRKIGARK